MKNLIIVLMVLFPLFGVGQTVNCSKYTIEKDGISKDIVAPISASLDSNFIRYHILGEDGKRHNGNFLIEHLDSVVENDDGGVVYTYKTILVPIYFSIVYSSSDKDLIVEIILLDPTNNEKWFFRLDDV